MEMKSFKFYLFFIFTLPAITAIKIYAAIPPKESKEYLRHGFDASFAPEEQREIPLAGAKVRNLNNYNTTDTLSDRLVYESHPIFYENIQFRYKVLVLQEVLKNGKYLGGYLEIIVFKKPKERGIGLIDYDDAVDKGMGELYIREYCRVINWIMNQDFDKLVEEEAPCIGNQPPIPPTFLFSYEVRPDRCPWPREE